MSHYDLAIIGAGIHGAAVADAAASRGARVVVLEQYDQPGLGTSSKSSKLIHGGLRYLESGQFRLVRECLAERRWLLDTQPDLVRLVPFHIPVYTHTRRSPWMIGAGLCLYSLLGGKSFTRVSRKAWSQLDGLKTRELRTVFRYWDAQTDDKRLTERTIARAQTHGARVHYGATFVHAGCEASGCRVTFENGNGRHELVATSVVNAAGPWVNAVLRQFTPAASALDIELVQGTHIVVPGTLERGVYYLESPLDGRAVFVMPWQGRTLVGTTETPYRGDPQNAVPLEAEIEYLIRTRNHYFEHPVQRGEVLDCFAGLRVLPAHELDPFHRTRDTIVHADGHIPRLLTIYGGKLTSHRHTALRVLRKLNL